ncbi:MAG: peptidase S9 [Methylibium sp. NZG]|nr:MAG: peptidase S9 [Methylibium sp. NZG]
MPAKKPLTIDDLWNFERVGGLALSPDGAQAVCSVSRFSMEDNKGSTSLWLLSTFGGTPRRLTACGEKDGQAAWSPTGDRIAFVAKREQQGAKDDTPQLYVIAPDGGEASRVSNFAPGIEAFKWFPDGKRIAFIAWVWPELRGTKAQAKRYKEFKDRKETGYVTSEAQYRFWDHSLPMGRVAHLHVLDVASGRVTDLFEGTALELPRAEPDANTFDIAPDGRHIAFVHDPRPRKQLDHTKALSELSLPSGKVRGKVQGKVQTLAHDPAWDFEGPRYSPDGSSLAFVASHQGKKHTMPGHLATLQRGGGWQLQGGAWDRSVSAPLRWAASGDAIYFCAEDRARNHLYRWTLASRSASVALQGGWLHGFDVAADVVVSVADAMDHPARVYAQRHAHAPLRLEHFNDERLARCQLGPHEEITFKGAQGDEVQMWVVYPPGFKRSGKGRKPRGNAPKKHPLLQVIHGGPHAASGDTFHYRWNNHLLAAQGYVVACVNYHGSSGFGNAFLDSITHRWGQLELQDIEAATDRLLKEPWADKTRVFASGGSYGGYMVAWMNGHLLPGRYQAYVCHAGCFDWTAMFADDAYTWHAKEVGAWYWNDRAKVDAQSPHAFAKAMRTPTLVMHGALDYRVPDAQGLAYYNTLKAKDVDARLVWFPDENHWILKPRNSKLWYGEFFDWLKRHDASAAKRDRARLSSR